MKFVLLKPWNGDPEGVWWNWNVEKMKLLNFRGGGFDIDENADYWLNAEVHEFDSWAALYHATEFNPLEEDIHAHDIWISPEGIYFDGDAHAVAAEGICKLVYDRDYDDDITGDSAEYYLEQHHWIKATRGFMWSVYLAHRKEWKMTRKTFGALVNYCNYHHIDIPRGVIIINETIS